MTYQKINRTLFGALLMAGSMGVASQAHALTVTPSSTPSYLETVEQGALDATDVKAIAVTNFGFSSAGTLALAYKEDFDDGESGNAQSYYSTSFYPELTTGDGISAGSITWNSASLTIIDCPSCYLVVKDGNHNPKQYVFDISGWNGVSTIDFSGFWANGGGEISHVAIFNNAAPGGGGTVAAIPEPETYAMLLAGLGLVGFAARRKLS